VAHPFRGGCLAFAAMIFVFALEKGLISRALSVGVFVLLGELSYSIYLIHQVLLRSYSAHIQQSVPGAINGLAPWISYAAYWAVLLASAYAMWRLVERPGRRFIVALSKG
jgi:peptidoglycan/LPS O-acetylase OafA/YrhL